MKNRKIVKILLMVMVLVAAVAFSGCGSEPETLEAWINEHAEAQTEIESLNTEDMTIKVSENTVICTYQYPQTIDAGLVETFGDQLEETLDESADSFKSMASQLSEESGIEGISINVIYLNGDGSELLNKTY